MSDGRNTGCLLPFWLMITVIGGWFGFFFVFGQASSTVTTAIPTPAALAPTLEIVLVPQESGTDTALFEASYIVINTRLAALAAAGTIQAGYSTEISRDPQQITIRLIEDTLNENIEALLTQSASVELVDFSSVPADELQAYVGQTITTTPDAAGGGDPSSFLVVLNQADILSAVPITPDPSSDFEAVGLEIHLTETGAQRLGEFSESHIGSGMAIVVNGVVVSVPVIQARVESPIWLTGNFSEAEVLQLAAQINAGPLPVALQIASMRYIGAG